VRLIHSSEQSSFDDVAVPQDDLDSSKKLQSIELLCEDSKF